MPLYMEESFFFIIFFIIAFIYETEISKFIKKQKIVKVTIIFAYKILFAILIVLNKNF